MVVRLCFVVMNCVKCCSYWVSVLFGVCVVVSLFVVVVVVLMVW